MKAFSTLTLLVSFAVAGCAGPQTTPETSVANPASRVAALGSASHAQPIKLDKASFKKALYVAEDDISAVKIFSNGNYRELGVITNGISFPNGLDMDQRSNLYVSNAGNGTVTEYAPGGTSPSFTYSAGMTVPQDVVVDRHGNVYEADNSGYVNQYFQGFNEVTQSCPAPAQYTYPTAVTVDASGDVFVSYYRFDGIGSGLYEYVGGLKYCQSTYLSAMGSDNTHGLTIDSSNNLVASANSKNGGIDIIAPPYSSVTRTIGSAGYLYGLSLNRKNKLVFAASYVYGGTILVYNYQTGQLVKTLGSPYGIVNAYSVVDAPNAIR